MFCISVNAWRHTYNVHDREDVTFHSLAPMILHHFRVSHHQRFHPLLFADWSVTNSPPSPQLAALPPFPLSLNIFRTLMRTWGWEAGIDILHFSCGHIHSLYCIYLLSDQGNPLMASMPLPSSLKHKVDTKGALEMHRIKQMRRNKVDIKCK